MLIGLLPGHTEAYERDNGRACVRQVIESIRHNGDSSAEKPRYKFNSKKNHVENNAHRAAKRTVRGAHLGRRNIALTANKNFCKKIYVESLSDMINVSPDYFTKVFKDSIGTTPIDYINALRVNRALKLLFSTDISVAEVAEATGFSNANYFNKTFKQYMDTSPLSYRKASRQP